ncbi:MAG TPA: hypothetical protein VFF03_14995, partial [Rhodocyclaceae bacterium]|nr:hypothetical protein [Rhodocyclaceae bacterium]
MNRLHDYLTPDERELNPRAGGRRLCFKGGSSSSSSSSSSNETYTQTVNTDRRLAVDSGFGLGGDNNAL